MAGERALGSNAVVKFCQEETWGTTPVPAKIYGVSLRNETLGSTKNMFQSETINAHRAVIGLGDGNRAVAGTISTDLFPEGLEVLIRHLLGKPTVTTTGSGPYTHVMQGQADYLQGLTIVKSFNNITQYFKYTGCRVNSMAINLVQEGFHEVSFDFVGLTETIAGTDFLTSPAAVFPSKSGFTGYECKVYTSMDTADGVVKAGQWFELGYVVSGSININNNIETDSYVLGSPFRASALLGKRECTGDFVAFFRDAYLYQLYANGTECALKFVFTNLTGQVMTFEFPIVKLGGEAPRIQGPGGINMNLNYQARMDTVLGYDVKVTIVNTLASIETGIGES